MSATITWRVGTMECYPQYQQEKDVVFTVHWDCLGSEEYSGSTYTGRVYGSNGVTYHSGSEFTPYEDLTQEQVLSWVWDSMGQDQKQNCENSVQNQINNASTPIIQDGSITDAKLASTFLKPSTDITTGSITLASGKTFEGISKTTIGYL